MLHTRSGEQTRLKINSLWLGLNQMSSPAQLPVWKLTCPKWCEWGGGLGLQQLSLPATERSALEILTFKTFWNVLNPGLTVSLENAAFHVGSDVESYPACGVAWLQGSPGQAGGSCPGVTLAPRPARECFVKYFILIMLLKPNPTGLGGWSSVCPRLSGKSRAQCRTLCQDGWLPVATPGKNPGWKGLCW